MGHGLDAYVGRLPKLTERASGDRRRVRGNIAAFANVADVVTPGACA